MKYIDEYQNPELIAGLLKKITGINSKNIRLMEVCGTHTTSIFRNGIRTLIPKNITLVSGPGCPVCVTSQQEINAFIHAARIKNVIITVFGDLLKVPGSDSSLKKEMGKGKDIRIVYSPFDALSIAEKNPEKEVVFPGIGFETTAPCIAAAILEGKKRGIKNFSVLSDHKLMPPALDFLTNTDRIKIDGFICPGHVSTITGVKAYIPLAEKSGMPCVVAGFEPADILVAVYMLAKQIDKKDAKVENGYPRGATFEGNKKAREIMYKIFEPADAIWRGIGSIPMSGLKIRCEFDFFNGKKRFDLSVPDSKEPEECACGDILMGVKTPLQCPLYKKRCTPENPIGPCMVSTEGTCAAYYNYYHA